MRVGDPHHLIELVRDDDAGQALLPEFDDQVEQVPAVLVVQRRGRLVEDEQLHLLGQCLGDLDELLLADADVGDAGPRALVQTDPVEQLLRVGHGLVPADHATDRVLVAEEDVLGDGQHGHQRELLVDDADAAALAGPDVLEVTGLTVEDDLALVAAVRVDAAEHLHQRGLAGAVLAADRVDLAMAYREVDLAERRDVAESSW